VLGSTRGPCRVEGGKGALPGALTRSHRDNPMKGSADRFSDALRDQRLVPYKGAGEVVAQCGGVAWLSEEKQRAVDVVTRMRCSTRHAVDSGDPLLLGWGKFIGRRCLEDTDDVSAQECGSAVRRCK